MSNVLEVLPSTYSNIAFRYDLFSDGVGKRVRHHSYCRRWVTGGIISHTRLNVICFLFIEVWRIRTAI